MVCENVLFPLAVIYCTNIIWLWLKHKGIPWWLQYRCVENGKYRQTQRAERRLDRQFYGLVKCSEQRLSKHFKGGSQQFDSLTVMKGPIMVLQP